MMSMASQKLEGKRILSESRRNPVKSIKSPDGDIIDCIHIAHQPAFDHLLLKNHTIQMAPNYHPEILLDKSKMSNFELQRKHHTRPIAQLWQLNGKCPKGTIPIRRTKKGDFLRARSILRLPTGRLPRFRFPWRPRTAPVKNSATYEYAYAFVQSKEYLGTKATINLWQPQIDDEDQGGSSLSGVGVVGGPSTRELNSIEAGWIVNPERFGDNRTRLYTCWTSDGYRSTGCYNLFCSGFVQTSNEIALGASLSPTSVYNGSQYNISIFIWKDPNQTLWWLQYQNKTIGYWPTSLFKYLVHNASAIIWGGVVSNGKGDGLNSTTQMGSGHFPEEGYQRASYFRNLQILNGSNTLVTPDDMITTVANQPNCYGILLGNNTDWGDYFYYGGPGKNPKCP
ncbi:protein neprosin [Coffea arabica]|uniref:Protein neprosin n=1 Tax=Coffea arabica TaxID=13443 RepID=A0A6P6VVX9_COFAR